MTHLRRDKAIRQYLTRHAESEVTLVKDFPAIPFHGCVVIPAYQESAAFVERFWADFWSQPRLLIVVINQPQSDLDQGPQQALLDAVKNTGKLLWQRQHLALWQRSGRQGQDRPREDSAACVLTICRFTPGLRIPSKQGVGAARKIGADVACQLIWDAKITGSWIASSDADALLPADYFAELADLPSGAAKGGYGAANYRFRHRDLAVAATATTAPPAATPAVVAATQLYEQWLHYYVAGLAWAGSPYAFYTIGSCLAVEFGSYCQVRGFPKRAAGEDFYLLNKVAKLAPVYQCHSELLLQPRLSTRVPFGTGPAVAEIVAEQWHSGNYLVYHPGVFTELKQLLTHFSELFSHLADQGYALWFGQLSPCTQAALSSFQFAEAITNIKRNSTTEQVFLRQLHAWFDGFRSLKFIRFVAAKQYPSIALADAKLRSDFDSWGDASAGKEGALPTSRESGV